MEEQKKSTRNRKLVAALCSLVLCMLLIGVSVYAALSQSATITNTITVTNTSANHKNTTIANHKHVANPLPISRISDRMKALCMRRWRKAEYPPGRSHAWKCTRISV